MQLFHFAKDYLKKELNVGEDELNSIISDKEGLSFLLIWSFYESKCYNGFLKICDIRNYKKFNFNNNQFSTNFREHAKCFHDIYKTNNVRWESLKQSQKAPDMDIICQTDISEVTDLDLIKFGLFVIYRYRNNIFHGYKEITDWSSFSVEIQICIKMMILCLEDVKGK